MYSNEKKCMKAISNYAGERLDYVQAGGGNTSYKFDDRIMAIKASGYSMLDIDEENGYVTVDYAALKDGYASLADKKNIDIEKESLAINLSSIELQEGMDNVRPRLKLGFIPTCKEL